MSVAQIIATFDAKAEHMGDCWEYAVNFGGSE